MTSPGSDHNEIAAVHIFRASDDALSLGRVEGYAAPDGGLRPCAVGLFAAGQVIATARAVRFSRTARDEELRQGWCGFSIGGIAQALAFGADPELRCLVSDRILVQWRGDDLVASLAPPAPRSITVAGLRERLQMEGGCRDIRQVLPFAADLAQSRGPRAFLDASYRYLNERALDDAGAAGFMDEVESGPDALMRVWDVMRSADEFRARKRHVLAGPFDPSFPFPLGALEGARAGTAGRSDAGETRSSTDTIGLD